MSGRQATVRPRAQFVILSLADRAWVIAACNLHLYLLKTESSRVYFHDVLEQLKTNFRINFLFKRVLGFAIEYV